MFTKVNNSQTGLYCFRCGKWVKWLSKSEVIAYEHLSSNNLTPTNESTIAKRLADFIAFLDSEIDKQLTRKKLNEMDNMQACVYAHAHEKDKNALINILNGNEWNKRD